MAFTTNPQSLCKVCVALDTLPDIDAEQLDHDLADVNTTQRRIAELLTASGHPTSRKSVGRHIDGQCQLGLRYRVAA